MPTRSEIELSFYERFFFSRDLEPYPVQERAFERIFAGDSVLVTVPTGTGKTLIAKAAIHKALAAGQTAVYTTPLRALTEEKYRELCEDFGEERVGFATGDYKVRPDAPVQVVVAEILWNRIFGQRAIEPGAGDGAATGNHRRSSRGSGAGQVGDVVIMDEGHYFNDPERGHVWEQSIIGLDPQSQLVILSATIGEPERFCQWAYLCRRVELHLVQSTERKVPLHHEYREAYLIEVAKALFAAGDTPAIIFGFGREQCFERARLLKSCPRLTTDEERARIAVLCDAALLTRGIAKELRPLLLHGIGVHHAGILPRYKQLVERLTLERLIKFVVSTETIAAGINLPAKRVIFPELRKYVQKKARLLTSAEYHQMSGRAGRPQFDSEGIAITLAPEALVQEMRKEMKDAERNHRKLDENKLRKTVFARARIEARKNLDVIWDQDDLDKLVAGKPAPLRSQTRITAEQILAIGLPDLAEEPLPFSAEPQGAPDASAAVGTAARALPTGESTDIDDSKYSDVSMDAPADAPPPPKKPALDEKPVPAPPLHDLPAALHLDIRTVIDNLLLDDRDKYAAQKRLSQVTANLLAMGIVDERGVQIAGQLVNQLRGIDGLFVFHCVRSQDLDYLTCRELVEYLIDHDVIQRILNRKDDEEKRAWCKNRLRERRRDEAMVSWDDVLADYDRAHPRELTPVEQLHASFLARLPHPELHGGKTRKNIAAQMEDGEHGFMDFVEEHHLQTEEGNLFSYLIRVMKFSKMLFEATTLTEFSQLEQCVRDKLSVVDERVLKEG